MTEKLLQYIWQFQQYNMASLTTTNGEMLQVLHPGTANHNQGPDFIAAKIRVGQTILAGNIELHIRASGWVTHEHGKDPNYRNIILHVVWEEDLVLHLPFPVLVLRERVPKWLLRRYAEWMDNKRFIPCEKSIGQMPVLHLQSWKERLLIERLQERCTMISGFLNENRQHWEETFWWMLARGFGGKVNGTAFEKIARSIPFNLIAKHRNQLQQLEAMLLGQAGLLNSSFTEAYPLALQKEYQFQQRKYQLKPVEQPVFMLRMRPAGFPALRLAQLAMLLHTRLHLFSQVTQLHTLAEVKVLLMVVAEGYWNRHYRFGASSVYRPKPLGNEMIDHLLINTIIPMRFTWGHYHNDTACKVEAMAWLSGILPEANKITRQFGTFGIHTRTAADSQALIQLHKQYCCQHQCLGCAIGVKLLRAGK